MSGVNMDSIVIGFSKPKKWFEPFSWLIRLGTWSPFSHAYVKYYNSYVCRWEVFQASGLKVNFIGQAMFDSEEDIYAEFEIPISAATKLSVIQFAIDNVGSSYAVGQIFGFPLVWFMSFFGKKIRNPFYNGSNYFCSELVTDVLKEIKSVGDQMDPGTATPKDVYLYLLSKGYKVIA